MALDCMMDAPALDTFIARFVPLERDGNQALTPS
jgi:hypothetical protein